MKNLINKLLNKPKQFEKIVNYIQDYIYYEFKQQSKPDLLIPIQTVKFKVELRLEEAMSNFQINKAINVACNELIMSKGFKIAGGVDNLFVSKKK
jgi:hypothetical protein